ncbi:phosphatidylethanolamine-binding protein 4 isoform X2 [Pundamilia nyererei]|uniref:Phosphatidylethanolamine binding protein 4 n=2 Tax=Haplochromini TaxID=319058 RepID=A0A3B4GDJ6_9CICH|nr:PREDICTED: phosphatidylethanolamine-binding protein 4 isoform X2 [Pundamilia nyererei]XP_014189169.1 phosphatidylethanolamine-binding protein 4 isoform X2 [Haplochromis burtoni]
MAILAPIFGLILLGLFHTEAKQHTLSSQDASFCHGELEVIYPELDIYECLIIPKSLREQVSQVWKAPQVYFSTAQKKKTYVLVMVDPDAPNRSKPTSAYWRHWLVVDIQGSALKEGQIEGTTLTDYKPPTPPSNSGFHRYQFMLFEQPPDASVSLTEQEEASRGKWDFQAFITSFDLGEPVATLQFLTQNYKD